MGAAFLCEVVMSGFFVLIIMGSTDKRASAGFFGLTIGVALTVIHLVSIPVTNTSVNPARSTGPAIVQSLMNTADAWALGQLWLFWVAPIIGGIVGGLIYRYLWSQKAAVAA
jgi:aquaporin Z